MTKRFLLSQLSSLLMLFTMVFCNTVLKVCFRQKHFVRCLLFAVFVFADCIRAQTCCFYRKFSHLVTPRFLRLNSSGKALSFPIQLVMSHKFLTLLFLLLPTTSAVMG